MLQVIARLEQTLAAAAAEARGAPLLEAEAKTLRQGPLAARAWSCWAGAAATPSLPFLAATHAHPPLLRVRPRREENAFLCRLRHKEEIELLQQQAAGLQAQLAAREKERAAREAALLEQAQRQDLERARREAALLERLAARGRERQEREQRLQAAGEQLQAAGQRAHEAAAAREQQLRAQLAEREAELRAGYSDRERELHAQLAAQEGALKDRLARAERDKVEALMRGDQAAAAAAAAHNELLETTKRFAHEVAQLKARLADKDAQLIAHGLPLGGAALLEAPAGRLLVLPAAGAAGGWGGRLQPLPATAAAAVAWEGARRGGSADPRMEGTRGAPLTPLALPRVSSSADGARDGGGSAGLLPLGGDPPGWGRRASMTAADAVRRRSLTSVPEDVAPGAVPQRDSRGWSPGSLI
jgi:hypothetical protein